MSTPATPICPTAAQANEPPAPRTVLACGGRGYTNFTADCLDDKDRFEAWQRERDHVRSIMDRAHAAHPIGTLITRGRRSRLGAAGPRVVNQDGAAVRGRTQPKQRGRSFAA